MTNEKNVNRSLLEQLASASNCEYLSDLGFLDGLQRKQLIGILETIPAESVPLSQWNDALEYLAQTNHARTQEGAKRKLMSQLSRPVLMLHDDFSLPETEPEEDLLAQVSVDQPDQQK